MSSTATLRQYATASLDFYNYQGDYPPLPVTVTYDLTSNTFSHANVFDGGGDNITLLINSADTAGVQSFNAVWTGRQVGDRRIDARSVPYDSKRVYGRQHQRLWARPSRSATWARPFRSPAVPGMTR